MRAFKVPAPKPGLAGNTGEEWAEYLLRALEKFHFLLGRREGDGTTRWEPVLGEETAGAVSLVCQAESKSPEGRGWLSAG